MKARPGEATEDTEETVRKKKRAKVEDGQPGDQELDSQELDSVSGGGSGGEDRISLDSRTIRR